MLSAMTTSENFPLTNRSGCPMAPYKRVIQPNYVANLLRQNFQAMSADDGMLKRNLIQDTDVSNVKIVPTISYYLADTEGECVCPPKVVEEVGDKENVDSLSMEVPKTELENELTDLLEQLELDDALYEQSKPLKIDPNVLKLDFSKLSAARDCEKLQNLCLTDISENKRASHHLSGGSLLTDASQDDFRNSENESSKSRMWKLSGGGLITTENIFNFEDLNPSAGGISGFLNQISPSSPLTFDLSSQNEKEVECVTNRISSDAESTNPFKSLMKDSLGGENSFSKTNPFSDLCRSSPNGVANLECPPPKYENLIPQKSFSQCSTRPTSPVLKIPEEPSSISNPFLINETSPDPFPSPVPQFLIRDSNCPNSMTALQNQSSFIFAVPVFPIFQQNITDSSTQTGDMTEEPSTKDPVYQNVTNQLQKFMKRNDHSEYDLQCLKTTVKDLRNSGWYYENVSWQESVVLLKNTEPGTFLIRDSSDPNFLFSLSVQTSRGPTSVRLHYVNGQFRLDAEEKLIPHMPSFNSVIDLIDYYVANTVKNKAGNKQHKSSKKVPKHNLQKSKDQVWIDSEGNVYSNILLVKPLYKRNHFSTLQHLARLTINNCIKRRLNAKVKFNFKVTPVYESSPFQDSSFQNNFDNFCPVLSINSLPLPQKLLEYLQDYPYSH